MLGVLDLLVIRMSFVCTRISLVCEYSLIWFYMSFVCHSYVHTCNSYVIHMSLVCTRISPVCHSYVLACHPYATCMYSHVTSMLFVCTSMSSVCHSSVVLQWTFSKCLKHEKTFVTDINIFLSDPFLFN